MITGVVLKDGTRFNVGCYPSNMLQRVEKVYRQTMSDFTIVLIGSEIIEIPRESVSYWIAKGTL